MTAKRHIRIPNLCLAVGYFDGSCQIAFLFGIQILTCVRVGLSRCSFVLELCAVQRDSVTLLFVLKNTFVLIALVVQARIALDMMRF